MTAVDPSWVEQSMALQTVAVQCQWWRARITPYITLDLRSNGNPYLVMKGFLRARLAALTMLVQPALMALVQRTYETFCFGVGSERRGMALVKRAKPICTQQRL
ncbi:uncharacterized protein EMH_0071030 [Eimeria mitis]|uniref:Uncharacterized protein n=1 Tax=Eimeria mitis TaxID=44415 RepID=U6KIW8_9EIME|nr:uncharacterized protein EMH_0071030 [Eimeria mitis]CDJ36227.1 hypothetical protein EMH_0071030 [Eimeria mitis]